MGVTTVLNELVYASIFDQGIGKILGDINLEKEEEEDLETAFSSHAEHLTFHDMQLPSPISRQNNHGNVHNDH